MKLKEDKIIYLNQNIQAKIHILSLKNLNMSKNCKKILMLIKK